MILRFLRGLVALCALALACAAAPAAAQVDHTPETAAVGMGIQPVDGQGAAAPLQPGQMAWTPLFLRQAWVDEFYDFNGYDTGRYTMSGSQVTLWNPIRVGGTMSAAGVYSAAYGRGWGFTNTAGTGPTLTVGTGISFTGSQLLNRVAGSASVDYNARSYNNGVYAALKIDCAGQSAALPALISMDGFGTATGSRQPHIYCKKATNQICADYLTQSGGNNYHSVCVSAAACSASTWCWYHWAKLDGIACASINSGTEVCDGTPAWGRQNQGQGSFIGNGGGIYTLGYLAIIGDKETADLRARFDAWGMRRYGLDTTLASTTNPYASRLPTIAVTDTPGARWLTPSQAPEYHDDGGGNTIPSSDDSKIGQSRCPCVRSTTLQGTAWPVTTSWTLDFNDVFDSTDSIRGEDQGPATGQTIKTTMYGPSVVNTSTYYSGATKLVSTYTNAACAPAQTDADGTTFVRMSGTATGNYASNNCLIASVNSGGYGYTMGDGAAEVMFRSSAGRGTAWNVADFAPLYGYAVNYWFDQSRSRFEHDYIEVTNGNSSHRDGAVHTTMHMHYPYQNNSSAMLGWNQMNLSYPGNDLEQGSHGAFKPSGTTGWLQSGSQYAWSGLPLADDLMFEGAWHRIGVTRNSVTKNECIYWERKLVECYPMSKEMLNPMALISGITVTAGANGADNSVLIQGSNPLIMDVAYVKSWKNPDTTFTGVP